MFRVWPLYLQSNLPREQMMIALIANAYINNINVGAILPVSNNVPILYLSQTLYERKHIIH